MTDLVDVAYEVGFGQRMPIVTRGNVDTLRSPLPDDSSIGADGYDMKGNVLAAVLNGGFDRMAEATAAGDGHPGNGDGTDIVIPEDQRQLLSIIHCIQFGASDQGYPVFHKVVMEMP